ncbi:putative Retrotransposon gag protein [Cocos nucifera]|nr:putative Retrotransposon gag protein [Cocos nucifera]
MSQQFAAHFISSRRPRRGSDSLMAIRQKEGEPIRAYVTRFNAAALEVRNLDQSVAMAALKGGLQKNDLLFSLEKRYPRDFADLLARAERYARAEEAFKLRDEETLRERLTGDREPNEVRPRSRTPSGSRRARTPRACREARRSPPPKGFRDYVLLNAPRAQILTEVKDQLPRPERLRSPPNKRDRSKYCLYHRDHGHDTEECIQLQDEIEELIRKGRLGRFIRRQSKDRCRALP